MSIERKPLDHDPLTGIKEDYVYDHAYHRVILHTQQDASAIMEEAQRLRNEAVGWKGDFVSVAKLPLLQCIELQKLGIMDRGFAIRDEAAFYVWLREHNKTQTTPGHF